MANPMDETGGEMDSYMNLRSIQDLYNEWKEEHGEQIESPFELYQGRLIVVPPGMWQIWPNPEHIGEDWDESPPEDEVKPLHDYQMKCLNSELIRNVKFYRELGSGENGQVFEIEAEYKRSIYYKRGWRKRRLACKVIRHLDIERDDITKSLNDMLILRRLRHKNICNMCDIIGIPDRKTGFPYAMVCLFLELCHGDFNHIIAKGIPEDYPSRQMKWTLHENLNRHWLAQITSGLEYLHRNDVSHRDIKPANILFQHKPALGKEPHYSFDDYFLSSIFKLADFGMSMLHESDIILQEQKIDVNEVGIILCQMAIPGKPDRKLNEKFLEFCQSADCEEEYRQQWEGMSPFLKDLIYKLLININEWTDMSAVDILKHQWLQNNTESRTEPFIWKEGIDKESQGYVEHVQKEYQKKRQNSHLEIQLPHGSTQGRNA